MNPDGTAQTEFVGNNSMYPASYLQARAVPDSTKLVAIISGHHVPHKGKLALIDRSLGAQDGACIEYVGGSSPDGAPGRTPNPIKPEGHNDRNIDMFGQTGPQYQYPYPLDEDNYLIAYCPEGWLTIDGPYTPPFGVYFMKATGERELLAFDWSISSGQPILFAPQDAPRVKASSVDEGANYGTFVAQDIYMGPGLAGIERGTVKKLRVVALEYRAAKVGKGSNAGEVDQGLVQTPVSFNNGHGRQTRLGQSASKKTERRVQSPARARLFPTARRKVLRAIDAQLGDAGATNGLRAWAVTRTSWRRARCRLDCSVRSRRTNLLKRLDLRTGAPSADRAAGTAKLSRFR